MLWTSNVGGGDLSDQFLSDESEEEFVGFFTNDSDSEISDDLMESQELEPGFASRSPSTNSTKPTPDSSLTNVNSHSLELVNSQTNIWSAESDSLAHLSSELLSSSMTLLGQNFRLEAQNSRITEKDEAELAKCEEVVQGKREVPVPPGQCTGVSSLLPFLPFPFPLVAVYFLFQVTVCLKFNRDLHMVIAYVNKFICLKRLMGNFSFTMPFRFHPCYTSVLSILVDMTKFV